VSKTHIYFFAVPRAVIGAAVGAAAWPLCAMLLPVVPEPLRFVLAWFLFTFGAGAAFGVSLTRDLDPLRRTVVLLAIGSGATPVLLVLLGYSHALALYPFLICALAGIGIALWTYGRSSAAVRVDRRDLLASIVLVMLALLLGAVAFAHRLNVTDGVKVFGAYDSMDLGYYAVIASEATHTVPPTASFYSGHGLNAAYYPQMILTTVNRFAGVPLLAAYYRYAWPVFLALGALMAFVLVRTLTTVGVAFLAVVLILLGGDFSYLAAWFLPHATDQWDYLLWPTNFLSPTMEVLQFNTWTPSLPIFFGALYAAVRALQGSRSAWLVVSAALVALLFQFKPFAFIVLMASLTAATVFSGRDHAARWRYAVILCLAGLLALPFAYEVATAPDRRSKFLIAFFMLPERMLLKLDLTSAFESVTASIVPAILRQPVFLLLATGLFFLGGLGVRWFGLPGVWRGLRGTDEHLGTLAPWHVGDASAWRLLAWTSAAGILIPFVLVTDPYVDTLQFYQTGLYVLWIFTAAALVGFARTHPGLGAAAIAVAIAASLPSSIHFLQIKWTDDRREPRASLSRGELAIANYLRQCDPKTTVILHDRPADPSLIAIVSARRVVLGWGHPYYAVGSAGRLNDVNQFYRSADGDASRALDTLERYHVTHVVVTDRSRVHPNVLAHLRLLVRTQDAALYEVE
jgi:hypothetical protein